jgi:rod shape-determining protein MreC
MPQSRSLTTIWFLLILISAGLLTLDILRFTYPLWQVAETVIVPTKQLIWQQNHRLATRFQWLGYWQAGQQELQKLRRNYREQVNLTTQVAQLREENFHLRRLLGSGLPNTWKFYPAKIIGRSGGQIIINQGEHSGLRAGMMVIAAPTEKTDKGILIGKIASTHPRQSQITTIMSLETRIPVIIRQPDSLEIIGEGLLIQENQQLLISKILPDENIQAGQLAITKGEATGDPPLTGWLPDLPIGVISQVSFTKETDLYRQAQVTWLTDIHELNTVFVITEW